MATAETEIEEHEVRLSARTFTLHLPKSYTTRHEVWTNGDSIQRKFAAALGVCSPQVCRMLDSKPSYERSGHSVAAFGGAVLDGLIEKGVPIGEVIEAGVRAFNLIAESMVTAEDIEAAAGNSEQKEGE